MTEHQDRPISVQDLGRGRSWTAGLPSCLWFVLGMGAALAILAGGLFLAVILITRDPSPPAFPAPDTASCTPYSERTATLTPNFPGEIDRDQTKTPSPAAEGGTGLIPESLLQSTPNSRSGVIYIEPFLNADAGNFSLASGEPVVLRWDEPPAGALRYHFLYQPHAEGSQLTIGVDGNPEDGVQVGWIVPDNLAGNLYGIAVFEDDRNTSALFAGALYSGTANQSTQAVAVLREFFRTLSLEQYQAASDLYGGEYAILEEFNPDLHPADHAGLLERACEANGFVCLPVWTVESVQPLSDSSFLVSVTFQNPDSSIYSPGGCCGASREQDTSESVFSLRVAKVDGGYWQVMDLPVYLP